MKSSIALSFLLAVTVLSGCDKNRNNPGLTYFPDMEESRAYETYSVNPNTANGATNQTPVKGTVPRSGGSSDFVLTVEDKKRAGIECINPLKPTQNDLAEGKRLYTAYCISCHGEKADGKGFLYTSGKYPYPPASLLTPKVQEVPDGEIFHAITIGFGVMGAHGSQLSPNERWQIVSYVKGL